MNRISSERTLLGITQKQFAKEMGVDPATVVRWEKGGNVPQDKLLKMRPLFHCDLDWLLGASDERKTVA
ncbi:MAG: helix-turn-helix transcriptional regulator [Eggerthellaceae bacterium]|nr:helix-turn-helix transcriptional regulator [Eggerthellaceae bacterium]